MIEEKWKRYLPGYLDIMLTSGECHKRDELMCLISQVTIKDKLNRLIFFWNITVLYMGIYLIKFFNNPIQKMQNAQMLWFPKKTYV